MPGGFTTPQGLMSSQMSAAMRGSAPPTPLFKTKAEIEAAKTDKVKAKLNDLKIEKVRLEETLQSKAKREADLEKNLISTRRALETAQAEAKEAASVVGEREREREEQLLAVLDGLQAHLDNSASVESISAENRRLHNDATLSRMEIVDLKQRNSDLEKELEKEVRERTMEVRERTDRFEKDAVEQKGLFEKELREQRDRFEKDAIEQKGLFEKEKNFLEKEKNFLERELIERKGLGEKELAGKDAELAGKDAEIIELNERVASLRKLVDEESRARVRAESQLLQIRQIEHEVQRLLETLDWEQAKQQRVEAEHKCDMDRVTAELHDREERLTLREKLLRDSQQETIRLTAELTQTKQQLDSTSKELQREHEERIRWQAAKEATAAELMAIRSHQEKLRRMANFEMGSTSLPWATLDESLSEPFELPAQSTTATQLKALSMKRMHDRLDGIDWRLRNCDDERSDMSLLAQSKKASTAHQMPLLHDAHSCVGQHSVRHDLSPQLCGGFATIQHGAIPYASEPCTSKCYASLRYANTDMLQPSQITQGQQAPPPPHPAQIQQTYCKPSNGGPHMATTTVMHFHPEAMQQAPICTLDQQQEAISAAERPSFYG